MTLKVSVPLLFLLLTLVTEQASGAGTSSSFQGILLQVTEEKLEELRVQKELMTNHFNPALEKAGLSTNTARVTLEILYNAVKTSPIKEIIDNVLIENLKDVLENSKTDPSLTPQLFSAWTQKVRREIERALRKCQYSYYFGSLLSEWLEVEERKLSKAGNTTSDKAKAAREQEVAKFSGIMFNLPVADEFNPDTFKQYLDKEFFDARESTDTGNLIKLIRKEASEFLKVEDSRVSSSDVQSCIQGLLSEDLLPETKKTALRELAQNSDTLTEVASLLTNRLKNLDRWEWPNSTVSVPVDVRRGLGGEYNVFLSEDLITSLFLQYVGVQWAAFFKHRFLNIYNSKMWKRVKYGPSSIEWERNRFHQSAFLSALPDSLQSQENKNKDEYVKIQSVHSFASKARPQASFALNKVASADYIVSEEYDSSPPYYTTTRPPPRVAPPPRPKPDIDLKQSFLHILSTEIRLHQVINAEKPLVVVQADLETFGHSVNHEAALIAMEKFGVSAQWLGFFRKFLQPSIRFTEEEPPRKVVRGIPAAHALSNLFGETLLFVLESVVNRKCEGMRIYRISDEFWFFNKEEKDVTQAWQTLNEFGAMVGLKVNEQRSGSVRIFNDGSTEGNSSSTPGPVPLPQRNIHWGYLELHSSGTFKIDQSSITSFLEEMNTLLGKAECTLEWIQIFNKYMVFFVRNFGKGALVFGKQHLDQITTSLRTIYAGVFGSLEKSAVNALKEKFNKLPEADLLDAWVYWPLEMGGLGLTDPFIEILALRKTYEQINDEDLFRKLPLQDKIQWDELKANYERNYGPVLAGNAKVRPTPPVTQVTQQVGYGVVPPPKFLSWEEYLATRETELGHWYYRYLRLLDRPGPHSPVMPTRFWELGTLIPSDEPARNYFMWLYNHYETQLELYFGTSTFINSELLPKSMIANIQKAKLNY